MNPLWKKSPPQTALDASLVAAVEEVRRSIEGLTGDDEAAAHHMPKTLVRVDDVEQFGVLAFAFDDPAMAMASNRPLDGFRPEVYRLFLACARARLDFLNRYTVAETWDAATPTRPSKAVFTALVYLHNLWVLCTDEHAGLQGLYRDKSIIGFYEPLYAFPESIHAQRPSFRFDDLVIIHAAVLRFLEIYGARLMPIGEPSHFEDPLRLYAAMRSRHPVLLLMLDQLIALSPLSRLWFLPGGPPYFDAAWADARRWAEGCASLFSRAARPLLMTLADYLVFTLFQPTTREADGDDWKSRYQMQPRLDALRLFNQFLAHTEVLYSKYPAYVDFRVLCCYYFYQSSLPIAAENYLRGRQAREAGGVLTFLQHCRWIAEPERPAPAPGGDTLDATLRRMRTRLIEADFDEQCRRLLETGA